MKQGPVVLPRQSHLSWMFKELGSCVYKVRIQEPGQNLQVTLHLPGLCCDTPPSPPAPRADRSTHPPHCGRAGPQTGDGRSSGLSWDSEASREGTAVHWAVRSSEPGRLSALGSVFCNSTTGLHAPLHSEGTPAVPLGSTCQDAGGKWSSPRRRA